MVERTNCEWFTGELGELKHHLHSQEQKNKSGLTVLPLKMTNVKNMSSLTLQPNNCIILMLS